MRHINKNMLKIINKIILNIFICVSIIISFFSSAPSFSTLSAWDGITETVWATGAGTEGSPYEILTAANLSYLRTSVNSGTSYSGVYFKLMDDIDLASYSWTPIGNSTNKFMGVFDGNGKTVSNLSISSSTSNYQGLFGYISGSTVKNLSVSGSVSGSDPLNNQSGGHYYGGIVGYAASSSSLINCTNLCSIEGSGYIGGIVGYADESFISGCLNSSEVNTGDDCVGGIVGYCYNSKIENCTNNGGITAFDDKAGGIAGIISGNPNSVNVSYILNCINSGDIYAQDSGNNYSIGGIAGEADWSNVEYSVNTGNVSGMTYVGGIVGEWWSNNSGANRYVRYCINSGTIKSIGRGQSIGGIVGTSNGGTSNGNYLEKCINFGFIDSAYTTCGSILGISAANEIITNCYYDKQMSSKGGISGSDIEGYAEGKLTSQIIGTLLSSLIGGSAYWAFGDGLYPIPKTLSSNDIAKLAASPAILHSIDSSHYDGTTSGVTRSFSLGGISDGVVWTSSNTNVISIDGSAATISRQSTDTTVTLTATKSGISKTISLKVLASATYNVTVEWGTLSYKYKYKINDSGIKEDGAWELLDDCGGVSILNNTSGEAAVVEAEFVCSLKTESNSDALTAAFYPSYDQNSKIFSGDAILGRKEVLSGSSINYYTSLSGVPKDADISAMGSGNINIGSIIITFYNDI